MIRFFTTLVLMFYTIGVFCEEKPIDSLLLLRDNKKAEVQRKAMKVEKAFEKAVLILTYMNYSDRPRDRSVLGTEPYEPFDGMVIRNIEIKVLKPYGTDVENPTYYKANKLQNFSNKIQFSTRAWAVKNDLQFEEGKVVKAIDFADTEKLLWERGMFKDLKLIVTPIDSQYVDVLVIVRDRWSWRVTTNIEFTNVNVGMGITNFFGLPHEVYSRVAFNFQRFNFYTLYGGYEYTNIAKSKINLYTRYSYDKLNKEGKVELDKQFLSADDRWAGFAKFRINDSKGDLTSLTGEVIPTDVLYHSEDVWLATSFRLKNLNNKKGHEFNRLILSGRFAYTDYLRKPFLRSKDRSQSFLDYSTALLSIGISRWDYYFDRDVYYLGRGEYFPKGVNAAIIGGWQWDEELHHRMYTGFKVNYSKYFEKFGYLYSELNYGGFTNFKQYQQVLIKLRESFYTKKVKMGKCHYRQMFTAIANFGFERPIGRENVLNDNSGLTGVFVNNIRGESNIAFNFESAFYPTFKVIGVSSCVFAFVDLAISNGNGFMFDRKPDFYQSMGFGLRLRNQDFGWGFIELKFAYVPQLRNYSMNPHVFGANYRNSRDVPRVNMFQPNILEIDN